MHKLLLKIFIGLGILAQFAAVGWMIARHETTLRHGTARRFAVKPVDPFNAFKGRSVNLGFGGWQNQVAVSDSFERGERVFASIGPESNGLSRITGVSRQRPAGPDYFQTRIGWCTHASHWITNRPAMNPQHVAKPIRKKVEEWRVSLKVPFNEYFLPEHLAPAAEKAVRQRLRDATNTPNQAVAVVRFQNGQAVLEDVEIDGRPLRAFLKAATLKADLDTPNAK